MSKSSRVAVVLGLSGSYLLVMNTCVCMTLAGEPAVVKSDVFADSTRLSSLRSELLLGAPNADDTKFDKGILVAQADVAGNAPRVVFQAEGSGSGASASIGVKQEFSTWSDLTAVFRPSRWSSPFVEGGSLSWLNYSAWGSVPARTAKVLLGEAIVVGATYAIIDASSGGGHDGTDTTKPQAPSSSSSPARITSDAGSASSTTAAPAGGSGGGSSTPTPPTPPAPPAFGETPF